MLVMNANTRRLVLAIIGSPNPRLAIMPLETDPLDDAESGRPDGALSRPPGLGADQLLLGGTDQAPETVTADWEVKAEGVYVGVDVGGREKGLDLCFLTFNSRGI